MWWSQELPPTSNPSPLQGHERRRAPSAPRLRRAKGRGQGGRRAEAWRGRGGCWEKPASCPIRARGGQRRVVDATAGAPGTEEGKRPWSGEGRRASVRPPASPPFASDELYFYCPSFPLFLWEGEQCLIGRSAHFQFPSPLLLCFWQFLILLSPPAVILAVSNPT